MKTVLITAVGGGVGQSLVDSLCELQDDFFIIGVDIETDVYARSQCDKFQQVSRNSHPNFISELLEICEINHVDVLVCR